MEKKKLGLYQNWRRENLHKIGLAENLLLLSNS